MLRKWFTSLRKRSKTAPKPEQAEESREQRVRRLVAQKEIENFFAYDGDCQQPIDAVALMEMSQ